ncbi:MAG: Stk1 family PASTA domain-containing Ser/Thr kinase [Jatrophihabitans sp.]
MTQPRMVGGRYELGELIGYGGMAEVHRGRDTRLNRDVAIKILRADLARDPSFLNRFRREAHSAAGLNQPSIVAVYDTGEDAAADGTSIPFIVMEFVEGRTLRDILKSEGKLPPRRAMEITAEICNALEFSHRNGIIHRDIKPANVMITHAGAVKVMDFGIARAVADTSATITQTANVIGTAQYLSPEQARGESVDARSDVYSTGCLLYELVTGGPPFQGDSPVAVAYQHVRENPVVPSARNPDVPRAVDSIVMKALAKNQLNRYQSAGDMRADLQRALANQPVTAEAVMTDAERTQFIARTPAAVVPMAHRSIYDDDDDDRRRTGLIWAAVVVALLLVIGAGSYFVFGQNADNQKKMQVELNSVVGQTSAAAEAALRKQGFVPIQGPNSNGPCADQNGTTTVQEGLVCLMSPTPGASIDEGSRVTYRLFQAKLVSVPRVEGLQFTAAQDKLGAAQLLAVRKDVFSAEKQGTVLSQSVLAYETRPPGTKITLEVSTGTIKLPNLVGKDIADAEQAIPTVFGDPIIKYRTTRSLSQDRKVAEQDPRPGAYPTSQKITLIVYKYSPPPPTCITPPPTPSTPSPSPGSSTSASTSASPSPGSSAVITLPPCPTGSSSAASSPSPTR